MLNAPIMSERNEMSPSCLNYLEGGGELGRLTRAFNWEKTPLGHPDSWSQSLLVTLSIMLNSKFPMFLWWGTEHIQFYNDAYRPSLGNNGKHPRALGQHGEECWPEIWAKISPQIDDVMNGGEATWQEDALIPIYRNGSLEDVYWTFSYSKIKESNGRIGGVLVTCVETTGKVNSQQENDQTLIELADSRARLNNLITEAPVAIGVLRERALIVDTANIKLLQYWGKSENIIGKPLAIALPELDGQPFLKLLDEVYTSGKDYSSSEALAMLERNGVLEENYFDFLFKPVLNAQGKTNSILVVAIDSTDKVRARDAIEQGSLQFRQLADSITQMVWITDSAGMHEYYNKRWYDFTGSDFYTVKGEGWSQFFHPEDRDLAWEKWEHSLQTGELYEIEYRLRNHNGEYFWVLGMAAPFYDASGRITKWFGTCTDIHEQKMRLQEKDDFISIASHELKTPLTSLKAFMQLINKLKGNTLPYPLSNLLERATKSADKIYDLVEDLLDVGKLNHSKLELTKTTFILSELIEECYDHLILDGGYSIKMEGDIFLEVQADSERICQVIVNFVNNAIKYAPRSMDILIEIEAVHGSAKISVIDKGTGIPEDMIPYLFDRYYRVAATSQKTGLGLGLFICSAIIKEHGGQIGAFSEMGKGSTFWFTLPIV